MAIEGNIERESNCSRPNPKSGILFVLTGMGAGKEKKS